MNPEYRQYGSRGVLFLVLVVGILSCVWWNDASRHRVLAGVLPQQAASPALTLWNTASRAEVTRWNWEVFLVGDSGALADVKCVTYVLDPTFEPPIRPACEPKPPAAKPFVLSTSSAGTFQVQARVDFISRKSSLQLRLPLRFVGVLEGSRRIVLSSGAAGSYDILARATDGEFRFKLIAQKLEAGRARLKLEGIDVLKDGSSAGATRWIFKILANGALVLDLGERPYEDNRNSGRAALTSADTRDIRVPVSNNQLDLLVLGRKP